MTPSERLEDCLMTEESPTKAWMTETKPSKKMRKSPLHRIRRLLRRE